MKLLLGRQVRKEAREVIMCTETQDEEEKERVCTHTQRERRGRETSMSALYRVDPRGEGQPVPGIKSSGQRVWCAM